MILTNIKRSFAFILVAAVIVTASSFGAFAAENGAGKSNGNAQYTNPETGYQVLISDDINLLTADEKLLLIEDMKPVTEFGHVIFWTTNKHASDEIEQARQARKACYEYDSASIFVINMSNRKLTIQSYGDLYKSINDSKARSITDNVSHFATSKQYYHCAEEAFSQMYTTAMGASIAEPMKYLSYVVISIMLGVTIALAIAFSKKYNPLRKSVARPETVGSGTLMTTPAEMVLVRTETVIIESSSHGGGGGGGCGGGGGGGCGGGGSSSF